MTSFTLLQKALQAARSLMRAGVLVLIATACHVGRGVKDFRPAHTPDGITVLFSMPGTPARQGELLAVRDSGIVIVSGRQVMLLLYRDAQKLTFDGMSPGGSGQPPFTEEQKRRLRLVSRYPQGIGPDLERRLLEAYGQERITLLVP